MEIIFNKNCVETKQIDGEPCILIKELIELSGVHFTQIYQKLRNKFLFENWNREFCINFYNMYENKEFIKSKIIGWCESSKVFARKRNDDDSIAIMLDDNTWCHFPKFAVECLVGKNMIDFWNFDDYEEFKND